MNPSLGEEDLSGDQLLSRLNTLASIDKLWVPATYPKGQVLFDQDNAPADVFILTRGLVKLFYVTPDGEEKIKSFIVNRGLFAAENGLLPFGARTVEPSTVIRLPLSWVKRQLSKDMELQGAYGQFMDWIRQRKSRREQSLLCDSATERFQTMQKLEPDLIRRLSQGDVARYLGVTPIAFSRIKRRMGAGL